MPNTPSPGTSAVAANSPGLTDVNGRTPSASSLVALDATNFFLAAVLSGFGPYVTSFLVDQNWTPQNIGFVLTVAAVAGLLGQMPSGAGVDQKAFDSALGELDNDPLVRKAEWEAIANRYRNAPTNGTHVYKFTSKKDARSAIRDAFIERHEANSKRGIIDRLTKWGS